MGNLYRPVRSLLFTLPPETAHTVSMYSLEALARSPVSREILEGYLRVEDDRLVQILCSNCMRFTVPSSSAAGIDKQAKFYETFRMLGAGFHEAGAITPMPQGGNPKPRVFRYPKQEAMINKLGFNNEGVEAIKNRARHVRLIPFGMNVGKNKWTKDVDAVGDYVKVIGTLSTLFDYYVINVSSPNTAGLRDLQTVEFIKEVVQKACGVCGPYAVIFVKLSPDLKLDFAVELAKEAVSAGAEGIIVTNTTTDHHGADSSNPVPGGGLSGRPLIAQSRSMLHAMAKELFGRAVLVSVGGISDGQEALARLRMGASLVQLYTGFVYNGPTIFRDINLAILEELARTGERNIGELIGSTLRK